MEDALAQLAEALEYIAEKESRILETTGLITTLQLKTEGPAQVIIHHVAMAIPKVSDILEFI